MSENLSPSASRGVPLSEPAMPCGRISSEPVPPVIETPTSAALSPTNSSTSEKPILTTFVPLSVVNWVKVNMPESDWPSTSTTTGAPVLPSLTSNRRGVSILIVTGLPATVNVWLIVAGGRVDRQRDREAGDLEVLA